MDETNRRLNVDESTLLQIAKTIADGADIKCLQIIITQVLNDANIQDASHLLDEEISRMPRPRLLRFGDQDNLKLRLEAEDGYGALIHCYYDPLPMFKHIFMDYLVRLYKDGKKSKILTNPEKDAEIIIGTALFLTETFLRHFLQQLKSSVSSVFKGWLEFSHGAAQIEFENLSREEASIATSLTREKIIKILVAERNKELRASLPNMSSKGRTPYSMKRTDRKKNDTVEHLLKKLGELATDEKSLDRLNKTTFAEHLVKEEHSNKLRVLRSKLTKCQIDFEELKEMYRRSKFKT